MAIGQTSEYVGHIFQGAISKNYAILHQIDHDSYEFLYITGDKVGKSSGVVYNDIRFMTSFKRKNRDQNWWKYIGKADDVFDFSETN